MKKSDTPAKTPRPPNDRGQGKKSLNGAGASPQLSLRLPAALVDKVRERGGAKWVRGLIEAA